MELSLTLAACPESAGEARRAVASVLGESPLEELLDTTLLLTSELVTNAILHARTEVGMIVVVDPPGVRVEGVRRRPPPPETREATDEDASGRGLLLVDVLAVAWGVRGRGGGKCVRFELTE